ncbi:AraC family transcriptional regulator [Croceivirga sp. JEA036]|uniref:AraC family transcriptional regulator n=1 Tax=Croceivirga sp. JEA036 TaxID=2721162 RepID=UPI001439713C|nr:AraC family transcriptional regulator [Croceivirga sp. JEA036]NJB35231.1 AraC family transcriptional regulator [Croceivirga sp. JEA036]
MKPQLEAIPFPDNSNILAYTYEGSHFDAPWHIHPQCELTYITSSEGTKFIGDHVSNYVPGELVLLNTNLPHCWKNHAQENVKSASIVVQWNTSIFTAIPELQPIRALLQAASHGLLFSATATAQVLPLLQTLPKLKGTAQYLQLLQVLFDLSKASCTPLSSAKFTKEMPWKHNNRIAKVHDFVAANYHKQIQLREIATLLNLSEQAFSRFFKKMMGRSFFTYLNEYRINLAAKMLVDTDFTVADIAFKCGYETLPFFFKKFKTQYQATPTVYRKEHGRKLLR